MKGRNDLEVIVQEADEWDTYGDASADMLETWIEGYQDDSQSFNSVALYAEVKLNEALRITSQVEIPNRFRTGVCCDLLEKMFEMLGDAYGPCVQALKTELLRSIFLNYDSEKTESADLFKAIPFFVENKRLEQLLETSQEKLFLLEKRGEALEQNRVMQQVMFGVDSEKTLHFLKKEVLLAWRNVTRSEKSRKEVLGKYAKLIKGNSLEHFFSCWRTWTKGSKNSRESTEKDDRIKKLENQLRDKQFELDRLASENRKLQRRSSGGVGGGGRTVENDAFVSSVAGALDCAYATILDALERDIDEIAATPNATYLVHSLVTGEQVQGTVAIQNKLMLERDGDSPLSSGQVAADKLTNMPVESVLLAWVNYHLAGSRPYECGGKQVRYTRRVANFTEDLADGENYCVLLKELQPQLDCIDLHECPNAAPARRLQMVFECTKALDPPADGLFSIEATMCNDMYANVVFLARLFCTQSQLAPRDLMAQKRVVHKQLTTKWQSMGLMLAKVAREGAGSLQEDARALLAGQVTEVASALREASTALQQGVKTLRAGNAVWDGMRARLTQVLFEMKSKGGAHLLDSTREQDIKDFSELNPVDMKDMLQSTKDLGFEYVDDEETMRKNLKGVTDCLAAKVHELKRVFLFYSAIFSAVMSVEGDTTMMNWQEFLRFVRDCYMTDTDDRGLGVSMLDVERVFRKADRSTSNKHIQRKSNTQEGWQAREGGEGGAIGAGNPDKRSTLRNVGSSVAMQRKGSLRNASSANDTSAGNVGGELVAAEWVEAIVRLAACGFPGLPLVERVQKLVQHVLLHACQSNRTQFRQSLSNPLVQAVFSRHEKLLFNVFSFYSAADKTAYGDMVSMNSQEFGMLLHDCGMQQQLAQAVIVQTFNNIQRAKLALEGEAGRDKEANFSEFLEVSR
jgi:hypothetical protein